MEARKEGGRGVEGGRWKVKGDNRKGTYINQQINLLLMRHNRIRTPTQPAGGLLDHIKLLQREVRLEERVLFTTITTIIRIQNSKPRSRTTKNLTFPKISKGRPINAIILFRSDVRNDEGLDSVGAREASGGEPLSSSVCSSPGRRETREYW